MTDISVVIPAYNEEARIGETIRAIEAYLASAGLSHEIVVVDDGSTDGTLDVVEKLTEEFPDVKALSYKPNRGKGFAVRHGMLAAVGDFLLLSDSDLATPIEELPKLQAALDKGADVAIASRDVPGSVREVRQSLIRETGGRALNLVIQALAVPGIKDTQCGFKLFTRECAHAVFPHCILNRWSFDVEVLYLARKMGYRVAETPVRWLHKEGSKVSPLADGVRIVLDVFRMRFHRYQLRKSENVA